MRSTASGIDFQPPTFGEYVKIAKTGEIARFLGWDFSTNVLTVELPGGGITQFHRRDLMAPQGTSATGSEPD